MKYSIPNFPPSQAARRGVTLSEVLVSTLIMSIGVVSVATLFPLSMMRSIQATQLTNAALLKQNIESIVEFDPDLIHDPDRDDDYDEHHGLNYLIDPIGRALAIDQNFLGPMRRFSGLAGNPVPSAAQYERLCMLPDTWQPVFSSRLNLTGPPTNQITVPNTVDLTNLSTAQVRNSMNPNNPRYRLILEDADRRNAAIRDLFQVNAGAYQLSWLDPSGLPAGGVNFTPQQVRVEVQERRYTSLLTVRKEADGLASVDAVVFFNRSFLPTDEFIYTNVSYSINLVTGVATASGFDNAPGIAGVDDDNLNGVDDIGEVGWPGSDDRRTLVVNWTVGADPNPFLRNGGYFLDVVTGNWYRIVQYTENSTTGTATIVVDRDLVPTRSAILNPQLVFYRGVLEVYPLGLRMSNQ